MSDSAKDFYREIGEQWLNGNRAYAIDRLLDERLSKVESAVLIATFTILLIDMGYRREAETLVTILAERSDA